MKRRVNFKLFLLTGFLLLFFCCFNYVAANNAVLVYKIPLIGYIDNGLLKLAERGLAEARRSGADLVVFEIDTYGGYLDPAIKIRDLILRSNLPTVTYVRGRAWSAGALLALAGENLFMAEGSSIGAAETRPADEKYISALRKEFKATAKTRGKNPDLAAAMVDKEIAVAGITARGKLLTLTVDEALNYQMADYKAANLNNVFEILGVTPGQIVEMELTMAEKAARVITRPHITIILLTIGILGLVAEVFVPGFGLPGAIGLLSLAVVFSSYIYHGVAGWGLVILFLAGILLLAIEIFVTPGFGFTGITGLIMIMASIYFLFPDFDAAIVGIATVLVLSIAGFIIMLKIFGSSALSRRISLGESQTKEAGYLAQSGRKDLLHKTGKTVTPLRPVGVAEFDGERVDVVSEGSYIDKGVAVMVTQIAGNRIVVKKIEGDE